MAASSISGDYGFVKQVPVILKEGNITVNSSAYGPFGKTTVCTLATEICQGDIVALSTDTANTFAACGGNFVVAPIANGVDLAIGRIVDEPKWVRQPAASQTTWATMLAGNYYRIATVELFIPMSIFKATIVCANATAITPGTCELIDIDADASLALHGLSVVDVANSGSANMIPLNYVAKSSAATVFNLLIGFKGFGTVTT
jgi:hypothetical protein